MTKRELTEMLRDVPDDSKVVVSSEDSVSDTSELHSPKIFIENGRIHICKDKRLVNRINENDEKIYGADGDMLITSQNLKDDEIEYLVLRKKYFALKKKYKKAFNKFRTRRQKDERREQKLIRKKALSEELKKARLERYRVQRKEERKLKKLKKIEDYYKDLDESVELCY